MSILLLEPPPAFGEKDYERDHTRLRSDGALLAGTTLDELITDVWEGIAVRGTVDCPVCASPMVSISRGGNDAQRAAACLDCGSEIR
jgi:hypothetical protein